MLLSRVVLCVIGFAVAGSGLQERPPSARLLNVAPSFALKDSEGKRHLLNEYEKGRVLVIVFVSSESKICLQYFSRIARLENDFREEQIHFLLIDVAHRLSLATVNNVYRNAGITAPVLHDAELSVSRWYNVDMVPAAFVLDAQRFVQYLGQIDDNIDESRVARSPLHAALESYVRGSEIMEKKTLLFGSPIRPN